MKQKTLNQMSPWNTFTGSQRAHLGQWSRLVQRGNSWCHRLYGRCLWLYIINYAFMLCIQHTCNMKIYLHRDNKIARLGRYIYIYTYTFIFHIYIYITFNKDFRSFFILICNGIIFVSLKPQKLKLCTNI